ncbi:MAG: hypothetical protein IJB57_02535, partial [Clostridia bacterium]|nr:hypothetical protein [Clostridia bacterium]
LSEWSKETPMPEEQTIRLINEVEKRLWDNVVSKRVTDMEYTERHDIEDELICGEEYGDIYVHYILATVYMCLRESERASQHTALFNNIYQSYGDYIIRSFPPKPCARIKL